MAVRRLKGANKPLVIVVIIAPIVVMGILLYAISASLDAGTQLAAPARGAGAGETGGANALGEMLARPRETPATDSD